MFLFDGRGIQTDMSRRYCVIRMSFKEELKRIIKSKWKRIVNRFSTKEAISKYNLVL